jgi:hypothetical protein
MHNFKQWFVINEGKEEKALALELAGNAGVLTDLSSIIPQGKKDTDKLLLLAAYYYSKNKNLEEIKTEMSAYIGYVVDNKMELITVNLLSKKPDSPWDSYIYWTQIIHGKQGQDAFKEKASFKPSDSDFEGEVPFLISPDGKIKVYKANSPQQCIILGRGESFCVSRPGNTDWQRYRADYISTFYFVYDSTRNDRLSIVVIDKRYSGTVLTDKVNFTGKTLDPYTGEETYFDSESYMRYLKEKGIDTSKIVNIPKSQEEEEENRKLGSNSTSLDWFASLSFEDKSKYIGRGHRLSDAQFDYLWDNKFDTLLIQYVRTGVKLYEHQFNKVITNRDLRDKYIHNRLLRIIDPAELTTEEYSLLNPKLKLKYYEKLEDDMQLDYAIRYRDLNMIRYLEGDKNQILNWWEGKEEKQINRLMRTGRLDIIKYFLDEKGLKISDDLLAKQVEFAAGNGRLDIVKYFVDEKGVKISWGLSGAAISSGDLDLVKYFVVEKKIKIGDFDMQAAARNNDPTILKYLIDKTGKRITGSSLLDIAVSHSSLQTVEYLVKKGARITLETIDKALYGCKRNVLEFLVDKSKFKISDIISNVDIDLLLRPDYSGGCVGIFQYLVEKGLKITYSLIKKAQLAGRQEIYDYLKSNMLKRAK